MRTTHLTFVSAAAMTISAACVYWITPAGGVASVARADVELAPAAMLEPDSDWFRGEADTPLAGATAVPTSIVTSAPLAVAPTPAGGTDPIWGIETAGSKAEPVVHRNPKPAPARAFAQAPSKAPPKEPSPRLWAKQQPASFPQQASFPQPQAAFPQHAAFPASTAFAAPSSTAFGSKK